MDSQKIYIIEGNSGEYSDRVNWLVEAHLNAQDATARMEFLNSELVRLGLHDSQGRSYKSRDQLEKEMEVHDPEFHSDYAGSYYAVLTVNLVKGSEAK